MPQDSMATDQPQDAREEFLARIRHALGHSARGEAPAPSERPQRQERFLRQERADDPKRVERWIDLASKNGVQVRRTRNAGITAAIYACLSAGAAQAEMAVTKIQSIMLNLADLPDDQIAAHLRDQGYRLHRWTEENCSRTVFECDASITDCRYGLADTGAMMVWSDPGFGRSTTLTVPLHIVLLPAGRIVADMIDAMPRILRDTAGKMPSNVVIINGPSKTADIEMNLVTGVHGPKFLYAVVIDD